MQFMPLNYYEQDISRETRSMVRISYDNGTTHVNVFGQNQDVCAIDTSTTAPNLYDYVGDVVIRKFPYGKHPTTFDSRPASTDKTQTRSIGTMKQTAL